MNSLLSLFHSAPKKPHPVEALGHAIQDTFNGKHVIKDTFDEKYTQKGEHPLSSKPRTGISELSVLSGTINELNERGEGLTDFDPSNRLILQISRAVEAIYGRFQSMQTTRSPGLGSQALVEIAHARFKAEKSVLSKLPTFVLTHLGILKELQTLKNTRLKDYNKAIKPLSEDTRNAMNALMDLNLNGLQPIAPAPKRTRASPAPAKIDKEESEEKEIETAVAESKVVNEKPKEVLEQLAPTEYAALAQSLDDDRIDSLATGRKLTEFQPDIKKNEGEESEVKEVKLEERAKEMQTRKPLTATQTMDFPAYTKNLLGHRSANPDAIDNAIGNEAL